MRISMNYFTDPGSGNSPSGSRSKEKKTISIFLLLFLLLPLLLFVLVVVLVLLLLLILLLFLLLLLLFPRRCRRRRLPRRPPPRSCRRPPFPIPTVYVPDPDSYLSIRIRISPYGSGSDFYYTSPDPIRITECTRNREKQKKTIIVSVAAGQTLESPLLPSCLLVLRDPEQQALVLAVVSEKGREADGSLRKAERKAATFFI